MTRQDVEAIIESQLTDPGYTGSMGVEDVRAAMVAPFLQNFILEDTYDQMSATVKSVVPYWVVAIGQFYSVFYDPGTGEFGLAELPEEDRVPHTSAVRGDLISTFRAM